MYLLPSSASHCSITTFPLLREGRMNARIGNRQMSVLQLCVNKVIKSDKWTTIHKMGLSSYPSCPSHWRVLSPGQCWGQQGISWKAQYLVGSHRQLFQRHQAVWHPVEIHQGGLKGPSVTLQVGQPGDLRNSNKSTRFNTALTLRKDSSDGMCIQCGCVFEYTAVGKHTSVEG